MIETKTINHPNGGVEKVLVDDTPISKEFTERKWRDSELLRTDRFVVIPDYPTDLLVYRAALRDYPDADGFPNGVRPSE